MALLTSAAAGLAQFEREEETQGMAVEHRPIADLQGRIEELALDASTYQASG